MPYRTPFSLSVRSMLCSLKLPALISLILAISGSSGGLLFAARQEVDLRLRIQAGVDGDEYDPWVVEFYKASGQHLRIIKTSAGRLVHIKHLDPGIYKACLRGTHGRERCQSFDMFTPQDGKNHTFAANLKVPDSVSRDTDQNIVAIQQLQVTGKARHEFMNSVEAELEDNEQGMVGHLKRALQIAPSYPEALNNLGAYYHRSGNDALALQCLTKVTQLNPNFYSGWVNLAGILLATDRREEALKAALAGLALHPDDALSNSQVARCYYYLNRLPLAEEYFKKVLALDPLFPDPPMLYLSWISMIGHREKEAEGYLRLFLKLHPYYPDANSWADTLQSILSSRKAAIVAAAFQKQK